MPSPKPKAQQSRPVWVYVVETGEDAGPLRAPGKPRIRVAQTCVKPGRAREVWLLKSRSLKKQGATRFRYDLMPPHDEPGGRDRPFRATDESAKVKAALKDLREKLSGEGYTVNGDITTWCVYVIELHAPKKSSPKKQFKGYLYVGQTSIAIEERALQHERGPAYPWKGRPKYSRPCHRRFKGLRLDLRPPEYMGPFYSKESALLVESTLRLHCEALNYSVIGGQERYPKKRST